MKMPLIVAVALWAAAGQISAAQEVVTLKPAATTQPIGPDVPSEQIVAGFLSHVAENQVYEASARQFVAESGKKVTPADAKDFVNKSLAVLSPRFKEGLELVEQEQPAKAVDVFEELTKSNDPYLAVAAANLAASSLVELEQLERCYSILRRVTEANQPITQYTAWPEQFEFMLGYCQVHNLDYEAGQATLEDFLRRYPQAPERLRVTAVQIVTELSRRVPGRLGDVHDLMNAARRNLSHGDTGEVVINRQSKAVTLLDDLIKEAEEQEKQQGGGGGGGGKGKAGNPSGSQGSGAKQSTLPGGPQREAVLGKNRARPGEAWGKMPPKQREEILQSIQKQFPARYRELLEQYYKELAKDQRTP